MCLSAFKSKNPFIIRSVIEYERSWATWTWRRTSTPSSEQTATSPTGKPRVFVHPESFLFLETLGIYEINLQKQPIMSVQSVMRSQTRASLKTELISYLKIDSSLLFLLPKLLVGLGFYRSYYFRVNGVNSTDSITSLWFYISISGSQKFITWFIFHILNGVSFM